MNENQLSNELIFGDADNILAELKAKGAISPDCETKEEAYEQATGGW